MKAIILALVFSSRIKYEKNQFHFYLNIVYENTVDLIWKKKIHSALFNKLQEAYNDFGSYFCKFYLMQYDISQFILL